jgi:Kazal-type serine protease inhibitor-like protein
MIGRLQSKVPAPIVGLLVLWTIGASCSSSAGLNQRDGAAVDGGAGNSGRGDAMSASDATDAGDVPKNCACARGAYVPVCGVDGQTYDSACGIACVPVAVACRGECPCPDAGGGDAKAPRSCHVNTECDSGQVCFVVLIGPVMSCSSSVGGTCVGRTATPCGQTVGTGCPCLDVDLGQCNTNIGGYCAGADGAQACWSCMLPV